MKNRFLFSVVVALLIPAGASAWTLKEVNAMDLLNRLFECPLGLRDVSVDPAAKDVNTLPYMAYGIESRGYSSDKGYSLSVGETEKYIRPDNPTLDDLDADPDFTPAANLGIRFPKSYDFPIPGLHPYRMDIIVDDESVDVSYMFEFADQTQANKAIAIFENLCMDAGAERQPVRGIRADIKFDFWGKNTYTISQLGTVSKPIIAFESTTPRTNKWSQIPAGYYPEWGWTELPAAGPYNSGEEPFATFIKRFNTDPSFRKERFADSYLGQHPQYLDGINYSMLECNRRVIELAADCGLLPFVGHARKSALDPDNMASVGEWVYPTADRVIYMGWRAADEQESAFNSILVLFERIRGRWYCTGIA